MKGRYSQMENSAKYILILTVTVVLSILLFFGTCSAEMYVSEPLEYYPLTTIVREVVEEEETRIIVVEDANGNIWEFENENEFDIDDIVSLLMYNNGTPQIFDDKIVMTVYSGFAGGLL